MWNKDETYENKFGRCAYLAGAIKVLSDVLEMGIAKAGVQYEALASDVFCIKNDGEISVNNLVSDRLERLLQSEIIDEKTEKMLQAARQLDLKIEPCNDSMKNVLMDLYQANQDVNYEHLQLAIDEYCKEVNYYLGKPKEIVRLTDDAVKNANILGEVYLYMLFDAIFIRFESHMLMFLRGSVE